MEHEIQQFLTYMAAERGASANTISAYRNDLAQLRSYFVEQQGDSESTLPPIEEVDAEQLQEYIVHLREQQYAAATVARKVAAVKSLFSYLHGEGLIEVNPAEQLSSPRVGRSLPRTLTVQEVDALLEQPGRWDTPEAARDQAMLEMLYATGMRVSEFVSLVSHELRTPLTSIIGFISLILEGKTGKINQKQHESLSRAHRQSKRLAALINDLLDISRIEAGRIEMKQERVQIDRIAKRRIEELRPQADQKAISLLFERQSDLLPMIGDADRIGQVFINLIGNAIKFTPESGKVTVRISKSQQNRSVTDGFHVEVIDTGPGIPPEDREKVFDKFRQLGSIHTRKPQGGTGLGLSIAAGIVEAHGGQLWVDSGDDGSGCNFQFFMPLEKREND